MIREPVTVVLFVYHRLNHTRRVIESLLRNPEAKFTRVVVYSDGPKNKADKRAVDEVRRYLNTINGFLDLQIIARQENWGLSRTTIDGLTAVAEKYGAFIMLEDDTVVSPYFLAYMNEALHMYEKEERVISVSGYNYPSNIPLPETFFLREANCWGWGTWARGWKLFESDGRVLRDLLIKRRLVHAFNMDGSFNFFKMLQDQIAGRNDSWSVRWRASAFLSGKLTLHPARSLVKNIGNDGSGTNSKWLITDVYDAGLADRSIRIEPIPVEECIMAKLEHKRFLKWFLFRKLASAVKVWITKRSKEY